MTPGKATRPRLTFESSWGLVVQEGAPGSGAYEMLEGFMELGTNLVTGDPPYILTVEEVPADAPMLTLKRLRKLEKGRL